MTFTTTASDWWTIGVLALVLVLIIAGFALGTEAPRIAEDKYEGRHRAEDNPGVASD